MILAEDELAIGADHAGIIVLADNGDGPAPGTPLAEVLPIATRCSSSRPSTTGPTRSASTASRARSMPPPARRWRAAVGG